MSFSFETRENRAFAAEIKYRVPLEYGEALRAWSRARLRPDPFGGGPHGDTYQTNSLYFDTPSFDVFYRRGSYGRSKYRVRRYGDSAEIFLERKLKTHDLVSKRRSIIDGAELPRLTSPEPAKGWPGHWFHRRLLRRELGLVCQVQYTRTALVHTNGHGTIRLTLDEDLRALPTCQPSFRHLPEAPPLTAGYAILELKYYCVMPPVFEELIDRFSLRAEPISKYRIAVNALELVQPLSHTR